MAPGKLDTQKKVWQEEVPAKSESNPFLQHPERPWRIDAWVCLMAMVDTTISEQGAEPCGAQLGGAKEAVTLLRNKSQLEVGLLRFYKTKGFREDEEESEEIGVIRLASTTLGGKMKAAFAMLDGLDVLDAAWTGVSHRPDRAPRGSMVRAMEECLEDSLGKKKKRE